MKKLWWCKYKKLIESGNIYAAKELLLNSIPQEMVIYKYFRGINRDWNSIIKRKIWLCRASGLNDPFDCAFLANCHSKETYNPETDCKMAIREYEEQYKQDKKSKELQDSVFVSCFSEKCDSLLMWSHYSAEHMGICVGYNLHELIEAYNCFPVLYSEKMPYSNDININNPDYLYESILTKSIDWSYECEWRIIRIDKGVSDSKGIMIDFVYPIEVYLGSCERKVEKKNREIFEQKKITNPELTDEEILINDEYYVSMDKIIDSCRKRKTDLYNFDLDRKEFKLNRRTIVL